MYSEPFELDGELDIKSYVECSGFRVISGSVVVENAFVNVSSTKEEIK